MHADNIMPDSDYFEFYNSFDGQSSLLIDQSVIICIDNHKPEWLQNLRLNWHSHYSSTIFESWDHWSDSDPTDR